MIDIELLQNSIDYGIIGTLLLMGFISIFIYIERLIFYKNIDFNNYKNKESLEIDITNNLSTLASFGSNATFIGLLGTVAGIIITFYNIGQTGNIEIKIVMTSLALALKATALGIVVAIPSVMFYNHLVRRVEVTLAKWEIFLKDNSF